MSHSVLLTIQCQAYIAPFKCTVSCHYRISHCKWFF